MHLKHACRSGPTQLSTAVGMDVAAHVAGPCLKEVGHDLQHTWYAFNN